MSPPTCVVIGHGPLPLQALGVLSASGFVVKGVFSPDPKVLSAGEKLGANVTDHRGKKWPELIRAIGPFDYLFSIVNFAILPGEVLAAPTKLAINYHDGPLPRYAGMNAPFWALYNGEVEHGITWHVMLPEVDAGDVLEQPKLAIAVTDTSFKLNMKCYYAAVRSFRTLVEKLVAGTLERQPQDLAGRSYFDYYARPPALGLLDFDQPAEALARRIRALDFGSQENRIGVARVAAPGRWLAIAEARVVEGHGPPGTVLRVQDGGWVIATAAGALELEAVIDVDGDKVRPGALAPNVGPGTALAAYTTWAPRLEALDRVLVRSEGHWRQRLLAEPTTEHLTDGGAGHVEGHLEGRAPLSFLEALLGRYARQAQVEIALEDVQAAAGVVDLLHLLEVHVPLVYTPRTFLTEWERARRCPMYLRDLALRSPGAKPRSPKLAVAWGGAVTARTPTRLAVWPEEGRFRLESDVLSVAGLRALVAP